MNAHRRWSKLFRPAAFVAANFTAIGLVAIMAVRPLVAGLTGQLAQIEQQQASLVRLKAIAMQEPKIQEFARQAAADTNQGEFLPGGNESVIGADLQTRIKSVAAGSGANIRSVQSLPTRNDGPIRYMGARIEVSGPLQAIQRVVHGIETGNPFLFVTNSVLRPSPTSARLNPAVEPTIDAQLEIFGVVKTDGAAR